MRHLIKPIWYKMALLKVAIEVAKLGYRFARSTGRFTSGETTFLTRFPKNYRPYVKDVIRGAGIVTYGGLISDALSGLDNGISPTAKPTSNNFRKKHYGIQRYRSKRNQYGISKYDRSRRSRKCRPVRQQCC